MTQKDNAFNDIDIEATVDNMLDHALQQTT